MTGTPGAGGIDGPFNIGPAPAPRGWLKRLLGIGSPEAALQAVRNRLAITPVGELTTGTVSEELLAHGVTGSSAREVLLSLFADAVTHFLADDEIDNSEAAYLDRLRLVFGVTNDEMDGIEANLLEPRYASAVDAAVADDRLTQVERKKLEEIRRKLGLNERTANAILQEAAQLRLDEATNRAIADGRLSPSEVALLYDIAAALGAQLTLDDRSRAAFDRMQLLWRIDNGDLPQMGVPINLQRNELCHAQISVVWYETRTRTVRTDYHGGTVSVRICKGVRYRVGSVSAQRITRDELVEIDRGVLYVTNKRLIFDGTRKNTTIRLSAILSFSPCSDGLVLEKATGKPIQLEFSGGDAEMFHSILSAAMNADAS